ncbi:4'-phosphopantetheinyl transferase family protein [Endozoicomonas atrinae]|uniref:4'-phosphopantetheinyl transferase family protein n=1 Tax=Endozoicomonas atrinae TaxID=1333660 RepID=UPI0008249AE8|nr:4'-phosphopantetheinyl transferase superfamily protein [Endozoicomonas atrinae]
MDNPLLLSSSDRHEPADKTEDKLLHGLVCEKFNFDGLPEGIEVTATQYVVGEQYIQAIGRFGIALPKSLMSARTKRQVEYLAGRYCATKSLEQFDQKHGSIGINDDGSPDWPVGFTGSITHSKGLAIAALASGSKVRLLGLDAEQWVSAVRAEKLSRAILLDREESFLHDQSLPLDWFFTLVFSAKESLYKLLRSETGRYFGFHSACITSLDSEKRSFTLMLTESLSSEFSEGYTFHGKYQELSDHIVTLVYLV